MRYSLALLPCVVAFTLAKPFGFNHQSRPLYSQHALDKDNSRFKRAINGIGFTGHLDHHQAHLHGLDDVGHLDYHGVDDTDILSRRFKRSEVEEPVSPEMVYRTKKHKKKGQTNTIDIKESSWKGDQNVKGQDEQTNQIAVEGSKWRGDQNVEGHDDQSNQIAVAGSKWSGSQNIKDGVGSSTGSDGSSSEEPNSSSDEEVHDQSARYHTFIKQFKAYTAYKAKENKKLDKKRAVDQMKDFLDWTLSIDTILDLNNYVDTDAEELQEAHIEWKKGLKSQGRYDKKYQTIIKEFILEIDSGSITADQEYLPRDEFQGSGK